MLSRQLYVHNTNGHRGKVAAVGLSNMPQQKRQVQPYPNLALRIANYALFNDSENRKFANEACDVIKEVLVLSSQSLESKNNDAAVCRTGQEDCPYHTLLAEKTLAGESLLWNYLSSSLPLFPQLFGEIPFLQT